ncbi:hypothetical protein [Phenylobacterium sp.]|uniref:ATP-grasp domain-containing protein n=1 Tax=Phenylobacterium sp. TaxID=1871053 RepID=UPI002DEF74D2|nr:hypothetical protein [Phenylobacterium sp.]
MTLAHAPEPRLAPSGPAHSLGVATLMRLIQVEAELAVVWDGLMARLAADEADAGALLDVSTLLQMSGQTEKALELQARAIAQQPCYRTVHGTGTGLRILAFMTPGDLMANTPLDFLLEGSDAELTLCYLDGRAPDPERLPPHDVAFLAVGQSDEGSELLRGLQGAFDNWPVPVLNADAALIADFSREGVAGRLADAPGVLCPGAVRLDRGALIQLAMRAEAAEPLEADTAFPLIVRPVGSHAGRGLQKLTLPGDLVTYLPERPEAEFYVSPFVDYAGPDGLFRKLRVVFVAGRPFLSHLAVSEHWMVHYLNAGMAESPAKRAEEAELFATFDAGFCTRHAEALAAVCRRLPLDYFGIDCAETKDGRLLVFEADVALIVHNIDPPDLYPYKPPAMTRLFAAVLEAFTERAHAT